MLPNLYGSDMIAIISAWPGIKYIQGMKAIKLAFNILLFSLTVMNEKREISTNLNLMTCWKLYN